MRSRRPGPGKADERIGSGRQRHRHETLVLPAATEWKALEVDVGKSPRLHCFLRPVASFFDVRRTGQARSVHVGEVALQLHHRGSLQPFILDAIDGVEVDLLGRGPIGRHRQANEHGEQRNQQRRAERHRANPQVPHSSGWYGQRSTAPGEHADRIG